FQVPDQEIPAPTTPAAPSNGLPFASGPTVVVGGGNMTVLGGAVPTQIIGGSGADSLVGSSGLTTITGGTGPATIIGGAGPSTIIGGSGHNTIIAHDLFTGSGSDLIADDGTVIADTVFGFSQAAGDAISFAGENPQTIAAVVGSAQVINGNTTITLPDSSTI